VQLKKKLFSAKAEHRRATQEEEVIFQQTQSTHVQLKKTCNSGKSRAAEVQLKKKKLFFSKGRAQTCNSRRRATQAKTEQQTCNSRKKSYFSAKAEHRRATQEESSMLFAA